MHEKTNIQIITYALYENLFLLNEEDIDYLIDNKIKDFKPIESICYSSFLNMICQTISTEDLLELQICGKGRLFKREDMIEIYLNPKIIYHRDNLLHYISRIILHKVNGRCKITGKAVESNKNIQIYGQILLLINNKLNFLDYQYFEREIIKTFPYHIPNALFWFYKHRIIRYLYIYNKILPSIPDNKKELLTKGIQLIENTYGVKFNSYIDVVKKLFFWFLGAKAIGINFPKFNYNDVETFYIVSENFKDAPSFINTIEALSNDLSGFYKEFDKKRKDEIDNSVFYYFQRFFDHPIFKINNNRFCIIDFKFLIEGICGGLIWKIGSIIENSNRRNHFIQDLRGQYGYLLEKYFSSLMNKIFLDPQLTCDQKGKPDCILECDIKGEHYIIIIEFTTKYYRISSLYNRSFCNFIEDLNRILFSNVRDDMGKFINLNKYIDNYSNQNKRIIPVLLTENWLGDFDLLDRIGNTLSCGISDSDLNNLKVYKPIILNLDDIETFWGISTKGKEKEEFITLLEAWEKEHKGKYWYNFANFISTKGRINNKGYSDFFNISNLVKKDSLFNDRLKI